MDSLVVILMGSRSDMEHAQQIAKTLEKLGIKCDLRIGSAHKVPAHVLEILNAYEADPRQKVYITIAGRSNALSGFADAQVSAPVIACPPPSNSYGGADIWSSLRMPGGVAPAVVLEPSAAALLAAKILGLSNPDIRQRVKDMQRENAETILRDDAEVREKEIG
jgi:5-(carboxyamino)imidazole ribonucleotide mutase